MEVWVEPRAEWKQMYDEIWRIERDFFYDPHHHGVNLQALAKEYEPYLDRIATRDDLNYLFQQMLSEINVGHMFVGGGDVPEVNRCRLACSAPITPSKMAATASRASTTERTGIPSSTRRSPSPA